MLLFPGGTTLRKYHLLFSLFLFTSLLVACQPIQLLSPEATVAAPEDNAGSVDSNSVDVDSAAAVESYLDAVDSPLPVDSKVRLAQLENGLVYYIRQNNEPEARAELRLVVNAGSLLEEDDQKGLAHFLEHMMFNGTERFAGQEIVSFLESIGVEFGPDLNAYTSYDETVYILRIPTDDPALVETAFDILEDWAAYATLDPEEIEKERGVVVEEWRIRSQNAGGRIRDKILPVFFGDSRYNERMPIGDMEVVKNAPREAFTRFYKKWYRPDLMAVIAIGDFDVDQVEKLIKERFSTLPQPEDPAPRPTFDIASDDETRYLVVTDPENPTTLVRLSYVVDSQPIITADDYRNQIISNLFYSILRFRLDEITRQADAPFVSAFAGEGSLVRPAGIATFGAQVQDGGAAAGLEAVLTEVERARRHGVTNTELERAKTELLSFYEEANAERENTNSESYADEYIRHYLEGDTIPGIEFEYALVKALLPEISLDDLAAVGAELVGEANRSVIVTAPEKEDVPVPTEEELAAIIDKVMATELDAYVDEVVDSELMAQIPAPVEVLSEREIEELGITEIVLANGIRVLMKPTDFKDEEVVFRALSPGGTSLVEDAEFATADAIASIVAESGVGEFDQTELLKLLAGKNLSVSPYIDELWEGFSGSATTEDLETLFQLIHLYVVAPRADEDAFETYRSQMRAQLENRSLNPFAALQDALFDAIFGETVRRGALPIEELDTLDLARGFEIYQDRFADLSDFTFIFVGSFDVNELTMLAQTYLGTLPAQEREETWRDVLQELPTGIIDEAVYQGQDEQSIVQLVYNGPIDATPENRVLFRVLEGVLDAIIRDELREELGGTYSPSVFSSVRKLPDEIYLFGVSFGSDPERVDELKEAVFAKISELQNDGVSAERVDAVKEQIFRTREEQFEDNNFWAAVLEFYVENPDEEMLDILTYNNRVDAVTPEALQQAAVEYLLDDRYVQITLFPEAYAEE